MGWFLSFLLAAAPPQALPGAQQPETVLSEKIDLPRLIDLCAKRLKLNIQYDASALKGDLTLRLGAGVSDDNLWILTNRLLASRGFTSVQMPGESSLNIVKLPEAAALARVEQGDLAGAMAGFIKVVRELKHRNAEEVQASLKPMLSAGGSATGLGKTSMLVIADLRPNLEQALQVLDLLDAPPEQTLVEEIALAHVAATALVAMVDKIAGARAPTPGQAPRAKLVALPGDKSVLLFAPQAEAADTRDLIRRLDQSDQVMTQSYQADRFDLKQVAKLIEDVVKAPGAASAQDRWKLVVDELTHTLFITTTAEQHARIADVIARLADVPPSSAVVDEFTTQSVDAAALVALVEKVAATRATVSGKPLLGKLVATPAGGSVLVVAPREEVPVWRELLERLDRQEPLTTKTYTARHFPIRDVAKLTEDLLKAGGAARAHLVTDELTGALILAATGEQHAQVAELMARLEAVPTTAKRPLKSFTIRNRPAGELVEILERMIGAGALRNAAPVSGDLPASRAPTQAPATNPPSAAPPAAPPSSSSEAAVNTEALSLTADETTNSVIAIGDVLFLEQLGELIAKLDVRQPQVMIEVLLVNLTESQSLALGVELQKQGNDGDTIFRLSSLFGLGSPAVDGSTLNNPGQGFGGVVLNPGEFTALVVALEQLNDGRSLTLPKVLVGNNQEAKLDSVLQNPFASTNASTTVATTSFGGTQDAGTTITLTPHIAEGDHLVLEYSVSLSAFVGQSSDPSLPPPRQRNLLQSMATIPDGYSVAVGGLEVKTDASAHSQVPLLGDIPLLGELFKSRSSSTSRSRFFVFIRATVLRRQNFEDLRYVSDSTLETLGLDDGCPEVEPRVIGGQ